MADLVRDTILDAIGLLSHFDSATAEKIEKNEETIDQYEDKLGSYLVKISSKNLSTSDSNDVSQLLHTIGDFERIGDHATNIAEWVEFSITGSHKTAMHGAEAAAR